MRFQAAINGLKQALNTLSMSFTSEDFIDQLMSWTQWANMLQNRVIFVSKIQVTLTLKLLFSYEIVWISEPKILVYQNDVKEWVFFQKWIQNVELQFVVSFAHCVLMASQLSTDLLLTFMRVVPKYVYRFTLSGPNIGRWNLPLKMCEKSLFRSLKHIFPKVLRKINF